MTGQFTYIFEELPLIESLGIVAGLVSGEAVISYYDDGEWFIDSISLDGYRADKRVLIELDNRRSEIFLAIHDRLTSGKWADRIADRIRAELDERGITARSDSDEHSTHYTAYSGV